MVSIKYKRLSSIRCDQNVCTRDRLRVRVDSIYGEKKIIRYIRQYTHRVRVNIISHSFIIISYSALTRSNC